DGHHEEPCGCGARCPCRPRADAERGVRERDEPVMAGWLLAVGSELERRQHEASPAARRRHLAGHLGVPRLVRIPERIAAEVLEEEPRRDGGEERAAGDGFAEPRRHRLWTRAAGAL